MKKKNISLRTRSSLTGHAFLSPFYIGFLFFFLQPFIQSLRFVFNDVTVEVGGYVLKFTGLSNLNYILRVDTTYTEQLVNSIGELCWKTPVILIASLFLAIMIKPQFRGRGFVRAIFFLPVIIASGVIMRNLHNDVAVGGMMEGNIVSSGAIIQGDSLQQILMQVGLSDKIVEFFTLLSNNVFSILWKTGIQTIIFLAGLQSIPSSLYEASAVEGSTAWEDFWKITLPMLSPIILVNLVYTIVDCFTDAENVVMKKVTMSINNLNLDVAAAMSWMYFLLIAVILILVFGVFAVINRPAPRGES